MWERQADGCIETALEILHEQDAADAAAAEQADPGTPGAQLSG